MDLSPEALKAQVQEKKLEAFREDLLPILEKHNAVIMGTFTPIEANLEGGGTEMVIRAGTQVIFKEEKTLEEEKPKEKEKPKK